MSVQRGKFIGCGERSDPTSETRRVTVTDYEGERDLVLVFGNVLCHAPTFFVIKQPASELC